MRCSMSEVFIDADTLDPFVTWGTNPGQGVSLMDSIPDPDSFDDPSQKAAAIKALATWTSRPERR